MKKLHPKYNRGVNNTEAINGVLAKKSSKNPLDRSVKYKPCMYK